MIVMLESMILSRTCEKGAICQRLMLEPNRCVCILIGRCKRSLPANMIVWQIEHGASF